MKKKKRKNVAIVTKLANELLRKTKSFSNLISSRKNKKIILEIFLIVLLFWTSSLITTRTTALYYMRDSDTNATENEYLANYSMNQSNENESKKYQTIAKIWVNGSEGFRNLTNHRTSGLVLCGYSFIFYFISILLSLFLDTDNKYSKFWLIPFVLSVLLLIISVPMIKSDADTAFIESINIFKILGLLYY